jgi:glycerol kinase
MYLALDQGGSQTRAIAFDGAGRAVAHAAQEVATSSPGPGRVEQDPEELAASLGRAVREVAKRLGARAREIRAAGLATQRSSIACWDRVSGAALAPVLSWQDRRAADRLAPLAADAAWVRARTGLRLSPHYGATKLAWCLEHLPAVRAAHAGGRLAFGPLASFLAFRLCRERPLVADAANAARTLLYDVGAHDWSDELCARFGVPREALPRCVDTRGEVGTLELGRGATPHAVPLAVLTGDQSAALHALGEPRPESAYATFGTGAFVLRVAGGAPPASERLLATLVERSAGRATFALEGTVNGAGAALAWAAEELELEDPALGLPRWLEAERDPPLFLNGVGGLAAPFWIPDFASRFDGAGGAEAKAVAVVESVAFLVRTILDEMARELPAPQAIQIGGGLARLDGLCRRLASLAGVAVVRAGETESTAQGLAVLLGAAPPDARAEHFEPAPDAALAQRFARWRALMPR